MKWFESLKISIAMYSVFPVPKVKWEEKYMRYIFCFFPFIGLIVGGFLSLWLWLSDYLSFGSVFVATVATAIPVLLTGGIHFDGFCDTTDALASHQPTEKKLEILKDSHVGAFAVIFSGVLFLLTAGLWSEYQFSFSSMVVLWCGFVLSRALSAWTCVTFLPAKNSGLLRSFSDASQKTTVQASSMVVALLMLSIIVAVDFKASIFVIPSVILVLLYYFFMSKRQFGGVTGDLAGYFLTLCEWAILFAVVCSQKF